MTLLACGILFEKRRRFDDVDQQYFASLGPYLRREYLCGRFGELRTVNRQEYFHGRLPRVAED
jgi:hypothetical protein